MKPKNASVRILEAQIGIKHHFLFLLYATINNKILIIIIKISTKINFLETLSLSSLKKVKSAIEIKSTEKFSSQRDGVDVDDDDGDDIDSKNMTKIQRKAIRV